MVIWQQNDKGWREWVVGRQGQTTQTDWLNEKLTMNILRQVVTKLCVWATVCLKKYPDKFFKLRMMTNAALFLQRIMRGVNTRSRWRSYRTQCGLRDSNEAPWSWIIHSDTCGSHALKNTTHSHSSRTHLSHTPIIKLYGCYDGDGFSLWCLMVHGSITESFAQRAALKSDFSTPQRISFDSGWALPLKILLSLLS